MPPVPLGGSCSSTGCQPWHWRNTAVRPLPCRQSPATPRGRGRSSAHVGSGCSDACRGARCAPHAIRHRTHAPRSAVAPITKRLCREWHGLHALQRCALHDQDEDHVSCGIGPRQCSRCSCGANFREVSLKGDERACVGLWLALYAVRPTRDPCLFAHGVSRYPPCSWRHRSLRIGPTPR